jgi:50S ribosomal protein L16 3-hydroxylase
MDIALTTPLLGGLTPQVFMRRHWQKKPLLVRGAYPGGTPPIARAELFELAGRADVQSRLVIHTEAGWTLASGPFARRALPPLKQPRWTLLVQGVDAQLDSAHRLLSNFRFVPDARLDDLMISYASDGGGVGPHVDSYDVFLLQLHGRRHWRVGRCRNPSLVADVPLKILANFEPQHDWLLEPGDMLYLPPGWGHDGVAVGECLTASIGFRAAGRDEVAHQVLQRLLDAAEGGDAAAAHLYRDPDQAAVAEPGRIPAALQDFAAHAVARAVADRAGLDCGLGEWLSEPAAGVSFAPLNAEVDVLTLDALQLDRRTRMLYDERCVFINGESFRAGGRDATLMRRLADRRRLHADDLQRLSADARELLGDWFHAGWLHPLSLDGDFE